MSRKEAEKTLIAEGGEDGLFLLRASAIATGHFKGPNTLSPLSATVATSGAVIFCSGFLF